MQLIKSRDSARAGGVHGGVVLLFGGIEGRRGGRFVVRGGVVGEVGRFAVHRGDVGGVDGAHGGAAA